MVQLNDDLWSIAHKQLGDRTRFIDIYLINKKLIGVNPNKLRSGIIFQIPSKDSKINKKNYYYF